MNNFVVEEYLIFVTQKSTSKKYYVLMKKIYSGDMMVSVSDGKSREDATELDLASKEVVGELLDKYYNKLRIKGGVRYASKYLANMLMKGEEDITIKDYANAEEVDFIEQGDYTLKVVRYYYDAKGHMYTKMMGKTWNYGKKKDGKR